MSLSLAGLAGDLASFHNLSADEAFTKLRSAIAGETEPLRELGVVMTVANLEAFALSEGITKTYDSMTQAEQATLRYQFIMNATADAQGDYTKTFGSLATQQKDLQVAIQTLAAEIGQDLMPVAQEIISVARETVEWATEHKDALEKLAVAVAGVTGAYKLFKTALEAKKIFDEVNAGIKAMNTALAGEQGLTVALNGAESAAGGLGAALTSLGPEGAAVLALIAGSAAGIKAAESLSEALDTAISKQYEYMDSLTSLADYRANGLVSMSGGTYNEETKQWEGVTTKIDYEAARRMQEEGTFKQVPRESMADQTAHSIARKYKWEHPVDAISTAIQHKFAGRHQSGEDFVMSDWTPAYLDYGERVLTAAENAKYTAMGGVDGMERTVSIGQPSAFSAPSKMDIGLKVSPREMAHAITPYVIKEFQAMGWWEDVK